MAKARSDWDIPGRRFDFKRDLDYGRQGEQLVESFLGSLSGGAFEVKTDRYRNGRMAVEIEQNPRREEDDMGNRLWRPSGLMVTKAQWWVYVFTLNGNQGSFMVVSVKRLKKYIRKNKSRFPLTDFAKSSSNPARGYVLQPEDVIELMISPDYDD